jgi:hypothetical protein
MCPGVDSASKNEYQDTPGSKDGRCVRLTTYHLHVPNVKKIRGLNLPDPHGPVQACSGTALLFILARHSRCWEALSLRNISNNALHLVLVWKLNLPKVLVRD